MKVSGDLGGGAAYDVAVARKSLDASKQLAQEAIKLIDKSGKVTATQPGLGENLNVKA